MSPFAGDKIAFRAVVDNRGTSMPFELLLMSSIAEVCGDELSVEMLT